MRTSLSLKPLNSQQRIFRFECEILCVESDAFIVTATRRNLQQYPWYYCRCKKYTTIFYTELKDVNYYLYVKNIGGNMRKPVGFIDRNSEIFLYLFEKFIKTKHKLFIDFGPSFTSQYIWIKLITRILRDCYDNEDSENTFMNVNWNEPNRNNELAFFTSFNWIYFFYRGTECCTWLN